MEVGELSLKIPFFHWKIDIESFKEKSIGAAIRSPTFRTQYSNKSRQKWSISLYPKGLDEADEGNIRFNLHNFGPNEVASSFIVSFLNNDNVRVGINEKGYKHHFFLLKESCEYSTCIKESFLRDPKNNMLKDKKLTVLCNIIFKENTDIIEDKKILNQKCARSQEDLHRFEKVLENKKFSDVTITADGKIFKLHKCILSSCSDVFDAMFTSDVKEKNDNLVEITDIKSEILEEFFHFIYTGKVNRIEDIVCELLIAADKYSVESLKSLCEETMGNDLTNNNVIRYLNLAIMNDAEKLKNDTIKWISSNFEKLIGNSEFDKLTLQYPEVVLEIVKRKLYLCNNIYVN